MFEVISLCSICYKVRNIDIVLVNDINFQVTVTSKQNIIYNTYHSPKKVMMDCELPELSYVPNKLLYLK